MKNSLKHNAGEKLPAQSSESTGTSKSTPIASGQYLLGQFAMHTSDRLNVGST